MVFKFIGWVAFTLVSVCLLFVVISIISNKDDTFIAGQMPKCNEKFTTNLLKRALNEAPSATQHGIKVSDIEIIGDGDGGINDNGDRVCGATAYTNAGKKIVTFSLSWRNKDKTEVWLQSNYLF